MSENKNILLVEDDFSLGIVMQEFLALENYNVTLIRNGKEALQELNNTNYDVILLDVMLPEKDGFSIAEDIRKINDEIPIIFVTAKNNKDDKHKGFKIGADDYITKPFDNEEFKLRIKAILKRANNSLTDEEKNKKYEIGQYSLDFSNLIMENKETSLKRKLTKRECAIFKLLIENKNNVIDREVMLNMIWGDDNYFNGRSLDVFITKLRKYIIEDDSISIINIHGVGFKLEEKTLSK